MYFSLFLNYLLLEKDRALLWNKLKSSSLKDAFCQVWLKWAKLFWRRRFSNFNVFSLFHNYFSLEKGRALHLNNLNPLYPRMLCAKFGWNWLVVLEKKMKMWKVYKKTDRQTDRQTTRKAHLSFQLRWAKNLTGCFTGLHCL